MNLVGELIIGKSMLQRAIARLRAPLSQRSAARKALRRAFVPIPRAGELQKSVMKIRMVPVEQLFRRFPADRARCCPAAQQGNRSGSSRAEHGPGQEHPRCAGGAGRALGAQRRRPRHRGARRTPSCRESRARGTIRLSAYHEGDQVVIEVSDDGRGLEQEKNSRGAPSSAESVTPNEARKTQRIRSAAIDFPAGIQHRRGNHARYPAAASASTSSRRSLENLKGSVEVRSEDGRGTTFRLLGAADARQHSGAAVPCARAPLRRADRVGDRDHARHRRTRFIALRTGRSFSCGTRF